MFPRALLALLCAFAGIVRAADYDVVVYSGVPCGVAASVAAAREGAKVLLIEPTKHVGGLSTSGLNTAETEHMLKWTFGGIAQEFYERVGQEMGLGKAAYYFRSSAAEKVYVAMLAEAKVEVRYGVRLEGVQKEGARLTSLQLSDGSTVSAPVFIDAGYEGDVMAKAGVPYRIGRESTQEFGEEGAGIRFEATPRKARTVDAEGKLLPGLSGWAKDYTPGAAHHGTMNYNWRLCFSKDPQYRVPIPAPKKYDRQRFALLANWLTAKTATGAKFKLTDFLDLYKHAPNRPDMIEVNNKQAAIISIGHFGGQFDYPDGDYATRQRVIEDHTEYTLGLLYFLANDETVPENVRAEMREYGLHKEEFVDNGHWPYQIYVREARRMRGALVVRQQDVIDDRRKDDAIALGSHYIDSHHVQRLAVSPEEFVNEGRLWRVGYAYQIPYRALTPKAEHCTNLLVPGAASYTHVAFCTLRLESTWMKVGHAAGVAAVQALRAKQGVQEIAVPTLQTRLREQKQIIDFLPGQPEKFDDGNKEKQF